MKKTLTAFLFLAVLTGCAWIKRNSSKNTAFSNPRTEAIGNPPDFALPGVPLRSELQEKPQAPAPAAAAEPAPKPRQETAAAQPATKPVEAAADNKELDFHLGAAQRYASSRKYLSAAAEYKAAQALMPPGDVRKVYVLERQGAMFLRADDIAKAKESFSSAIQRAQSLNLAGNDLANAYLGLAYCLELEKNIPAAIENYQKVLPLSASNIIKGRVTQTIANLKKAGK